MTTEALKFMEAIRLDIHRQAGILLTAQCMESFTEERQEENNKYIIDIAFNEGSPATIRITLNVDPDE